MEIPQRLICFVLARALHFAQSPNSLHRDSPEWQYMSHGHVEAGGVCFCFLDGPRARGDYGFVGIVSERLTLARHCGSLRCWSEVANELTVRVT